MSTAPSSDVHRYVHPDPDRLAAWRRVYDNYLVVTDIYESLARRLTALSVQRLAEIGGGRGPVSELLDTMTVVLDRDEEMIAECSRPAVRGDLGALPFAASSFDGVAAINCLYFLDDPRIGLGEARRVLRPRGVFVASSPSRWNDPELEGIDPNWGTASSFDAEDAPALVSSVFGDVDVEPWSIVAYVLPDRAAIADYLHAFNVRDWDARAAEIEPPLSITKVGASVWARA
jgi:SAM-dependent methyltransferase